MISSKRSLAALARQAETVMPKPWDCEVCDFDFYEAGPDNCPECAKKQRDKALDLMRRALPYVKYNEDGGLRKGIGARDIAKKIETLLSKGDQDD